MSHRWNGRETPPTKDDVRDRYLLTKRGMIAAICLAAEPITVPACQVTVYDPDATSQERGVRTWKARPCGEHAPYDGLCGRHADERERLR